MKLNFGALALTGHLILSIVLGNAFASEAHKTLSKESSMGGCRVKQMYKLNESAFYWHSCMSCYSYMPEDYFHPNEKLEQDRYSFLGRLYSNKTGTPVYFDYNSDENIILNISATIKEEKGLNLWNQCCEASKRCCHKMLEDPHTLQGQPFCRRHWDGWQCIEDTIVNTTVKVPCPPYIYFYSDPPKSCPYYGSKTCHPNETWEYLTNYGSCGNSEVLKRRQYVNVGAFAFSLAFLIPAIVIFSSYRQLRVPRITMHTNLFVALILNGTAVIIYKLVIGLSALDEGSDASGIVGRNSAECKIALILTKYTRMTTYMWMFCEGFYLHKLVVTAFAEQTRLFLYYIIGWVFPIFPVAIYATVRKLLADEKCWMLQEGGYDWIINAPILLSLAMNSLFIINIIRALVSLQTTHSDEPNQFRKAVKATLVLVPVFGIHFLSTIYLPHHGDCLAIQFYYYFSYVIDGLQGFIVSLIFCYLNGEILTLLARTFNTFREQLQLGFESSRKNTSTHEEAKDKV